MPRRRRNKHYTLQRGKPPMWKGYKPPAPFSKDPRQLGSPGIIAPVASAVPMREPVQIDIEAFIASLPKEN